MKRLGQVDQIGHVFAEATPSKANRGFEEFRPDTLIHSTCSCDFVYICPRSFTDCAESIDTTYSLCEHCICGEFRQLTRPQRCRYNTVLRDPRRVNFREKLCCQYR